MISISVYPSVRPSVRPFKFVRKHFRSLCDLFGHALAPNPYSGGVKFTIFGHPYYILSLSYLFPGVHQVYTLPNLFPIGMGGHFTCTIACLLQLLS